MVHNQSDVPFRPIIPYSRQLLHTRTLQARQKAPRFIIRPNSDRHRPQLLFGSMFHNPRLFVKLRLPPPPARLALFGGGWWWPLAKRPLFRSMASSDFNRLQQKNGKITWNQFEEKTVLFTSGYFSTSSYWGKLKSLIDDFLPITFTCKNNVSLNNSLCKKHFHESSQIEKHYFSQTFSL